MCGLLGSSSPKPIDKLKMNLLYMCNIERGKHSCGFSDGKKIIKAVGSSEDFIPNQVYGKDFPKVVKSFIGHTRHATKGSKTTENAHPFKIKGSKRTVIGSHNGTIDNFEEIKEIFGLDCDVDSQMIYRLLTEYDIEQILPLLQGALTLTWHDLTDKHMYIYRFGRPLYMGRDSEDSDILWFSSLEEYLKSIDCSDIEEVEKHTLYKIKDGKLVSKKKLDRKLEPMESIFYSRGTYFQKLNIMTKIDYLEALNNEQVNQWLAKKDKTIDNKESKVSSKKDMPDHSKMFFFGNTVFHFWFNLANLHEVYVKRGSYPTRLYNLTDGEDNVELWSLNQALAMEIYQDYYDRMEANEIMKEIVCH